MGRARVLALFGLGLALVVVGLSLPYAVPTDQSYHYEATPIEEVNYSLDSSARVDFGNLSDAERSVVSAAISRDGRVTRDSPVSGDHFSTSTDETSRVVVERSDRRFLVTATGSRSGFGLWYWGRPILVVAGLLSWLGALVALGVGIVRRR